MHKFISVHYNMKMTDFFAANEIEKENNSENKLVTLW